MIDIVVYHGYCCENCKAIAFIDTSCNILKYCRSCKSTSVKKDTSKAVNILSNNGKKPRSYVEAIMKDYADNSKLVQTYGEPDTAIFFIV